ncbi:MAG: OmpA family protein [Polyangiales bacterium]
MSNPIAKASLLAVLALGCARSSPPAPTVAHAGCNSDSECAGRGGVCVAGACQQCRADADCPGGACRQNRCEAAPQRPVEGVVVQAEDGRASCFERVFFAYDDANLGDDARRSLQRTADCLRREPGRRFVLTGHADPRGSVEYNLALGHRRAQATLAYLVALGVPRDQLAASSVGSEYAEGHDEEGWARDRRVEYQERSAAQSR